MFKSGVMDTDQHICPCVVGQQHCALEARRGQDSAMNQPLMVHHIFGTDPWDGSPSATGASAVADTLQGHAM